MKSPNEKLSDEVSNFILWVYQAIGRFLAYINVVNSSLTSLLIHYNGYILGSVLNHVCWVFHVFFVNGNVNGGLDEPLFNSK